MRAGTSLLVASLAGAMLVGGCGGGVQQNDYEGTVRSKQALAVSAEKFGEAYREFADTRWERFEDNQYYRFEFDADGTIRTQSYSPHNTDISKRQVDQRTDKTAMLKSISEEDCLGSFKGGYLFRFSSGEVESGHSTTTFRNGGAAILRINGKNLEFSTGDGIFNGIKGTYSLAKEHRLGSDYEAFVGTCWKWKDTRSDFEKTIYFNRYGEMIFDIKNSPKYGDSMSIRTFDKVVSTTEDLALRLFSNEEFDGGRFSGRTVFSNPEDKEDVFRFALKDNSLEISSKSKRVGVDLGWRTVPTIFVPEISEWRPTGKGSSRIRRKLDSILKQQISKENGEE